ncbi:MAG: roadblock/LC7 domain-containing protein [Promethearchaeota archaeon]|jgi:predicted regulator of Ras-like GTPase activity (Roadblock/LC7/MglB family)
MTGDNNTVLERLEAVLKKLVSSNSKITMATITTVEGLPILSVLPRKANETIISAMVATLLSLSERTVVEMEIGEFKQLFIKGINGFLLVFDAEVSVLAVSTNKDAQLGLIIFECERTALEITKILSSDD